MISIQVLLVSRGSVNSLLGGGGAELRFLRLMNYLGTRDTLLTTNKEFVDALPPTGILIGEDQIIYPDHYMGIPEFNRWLCSTVSVLRPQLVHLVEIQKSLVPFYMWLNKARHGVKLKVVSSMVWIKLLPGGNPKMTQVALSRYLRNMSTLIDVLYPSAVNSRWLRLYSDKVRISPCTCTDYSSLEAAHEKSNVISYVGRFIPDKNPILFLESIQALLSSHAQLADFWKFCVLGAGPLEKQLRRFLQDYGLSSNVEIGADYSSRDLLSKSKVYVTLYVPTDYPSQALFEAMACENAVVAGDAPDTRSIVDEQCGVLVGRSAEDVAEAEALSRLVANEDLMAQLGKKARERVVTTQTVERFSNYMVRFLEEALSSVAA